MSRDFFVQRILQRLKQIKLKKNSDMYLGFMPITKITNVVVKMNLANHVIPWYTEEWIENIKGTKDRIFQRSYSRIVLKFLIHKDNILGLIRPNFCSKKESFDERPLSPGLINDYDSKTFVQIERQKTNWYRGSNWRFQKWMTNLI